MYFLLKILYDHFIFSNSAISLSRSGYCFHFSLLAFERIKPFLTSPFNPFSRKELLQNLIKQSFLLFPRCIVNLPPYIKFNKLELSYNRDSKTRTLHRLFKKAYQNHQSRVFYYTSAVITSKNEEILTRLLLIFWDKVFLFILSKIQYFYRER